MLREMLAAAGSLLQDSTLAWGVPDHMHPTMMQNSLHEGDCVHGSRTLTHDVLALGHSWVAARGRLVHCKMQGADAKEIGLPKGFRVPMFK